MHLRKYSHRAKKEVGKFCLRREGAPLEAAPPQNEAHRTEFSRSSQLIADRRVCSASCVCHRMPPKNADLEGGTSTGAPGGGHPQGTGGLKIRDGTRSTDTTMKPVGDVADARSWVAAVPEPLRKTQTARQTLPLAATPMSLTIVARGSLENAPHPCSVGFRCVGVHRCGGGRAAKTQAKRWPLTPLSHNTRDAP